MKNELFLEKFPVEINRYYVCTYQGNQDLCKIVRGTEDVNSSGINVFCYKVICYYLATDIYSGSIAECKSWIREHIVGGKYIHGQY